MNIGIVVTIALGLVVNSVTSNAFAAATDYEFQPVTVDVKNGATSELAVRLIHKPTGKAVSGAVILSTRLDMSPDGMEDMMAKHDALPESEPGIYRFRADFSMKGRWAFTLEAKVPGELKTVEGRVVFRAK